MEIYTVRDLIEYLQQFNPDSQVYDIDGMSIIPPHPEPPGEQNATHNGPPSTAA